MKTRSDHIVSEEPGPTEAPFSIKNMLSVWLKAKRFSAPDILILLLLSAILLAGLTQQQLNPDTERYQCYAFAFWHGTPALPALPAHQCTFITHPSDKTAAETHDAFLGSIKRSALPTQVFTEIASQSATQPFHLLPYEYPLLALLSFTSALITPFGWYQATFAFGMFCIAAGLYLLLLRRCSRGAALAFALYLIIGCFVTTLGRFDLLPTACTFGALLCAERAKWKYAFFLLAIATMIKFYPIVLLIPLLIAQHKQQQAIPHKLHAAWQRYTPLAIFISTCTVITILSLAASVEGTVAPLIYLGARPLQIESTSASIVWLISTIGRYPLTYIFSFGSRNVLSQFSAPIIQGNSFLFLAGLCFVYWLQWRQKVALSLTFLLTLLIVIVTGKVFSAQYLIWLAPFMAYIGGWDRKWLLGWGSISLITTLIYPFIYNRAQYPFESLLPELYATICVRNSLLLVLTCFLLYLATRNHFRTDAQ